MVSRGLAGRGPGCLPKQTAPLGEGGTSCPWESGDKASGKDKYILKRTEVVCLREYLYTRVHSGAIRNCQKVETTHMSINKG